MTFFGGVNKFLPHSKIICIIF